jgi:hypothetical protein
MRNAGVLPSEASGHLQQLRLRYEQQKRSTLNCQSRLSSFFGNSRRIELSNSSGYGTFKKYHQRVRFLRYAHRRDALDFHHSPILSRALDNLPLLELIHRFILVELLRGFNPVVVIHDTFQSTPRKLKGYSYMLRLN